MCHSHTIYNLCGHINLKTIVQCADQVDKLLRSGQAALTHGVCENTDVTDKSHVFPDICRKCKQVGVIAEALEGAEKKVEVLREWNELHKAKGQEIPAIVVTADDDSDKIKDLETLDLVEVEDTSVQHSSSESTLMTREEPESASTKNHTSSMTSHGPAPNLEELIKTRLVALRSRTKRLLAKIRASKHPELGTKANKEM
jgi:hypothetical protein